MEAHDVEVLYAKGQASGCAVFLEPEEKWYRRNDVYLGNKQFIVLDPDGYMLRFYRDLGPDETGQIFICYIHY